MKWYLVLFSFFSIAANAGLPPYVGSTSHEMMLDYDSAVVFHSDKEPTFSEVRSKIDLQTQFTIGPMFHGYGGSVAAPWGNPEIEVKDVRSSGAGLYKAQYHLHGKAVVSDQGKTLKILLPINPDEMEKKVNAGCTVHYGAWYDWTPSCGGLKENVDYTSISVPVIWINNTTRTFPEYHRLFDENRTITTTILVGSNLNGDPANDQDIFKKDFYVSSIWLMLNGFKRTALTKEEIVQRYQLKPGDQIPVVESYEKKTAKGKWVVHLYFGTTGIGADSKTFHQELKTALETNSIVIYSGHSGLGKNLNLDKIEALRGFKFNLPKDKYQILFISGCLTYSYYGQQFFERKKSEFDPYGTKNLDEFTVALEGYSDSKELTIMKRVNDWMDGREASLGQEHFSYQSMASDLRDSITGIAGDEDNPDYLEMTDL